MNQMDFRSRCAVVTGGAAGIGLAVAKRIAASGGRVALWDRDEYALAAARTAVGAGTVTHALDVADSAAVESAARAAETELGGVDVLVCSAGITGPNATTWEYPVDAWRQVFDVNVHGLFYCNRAIVPVMPRDSNWNTAVVLPLRNMSKVAASSSGNSARSTEDSGVSKVT